MISASKEYNAAIVDRARRIYVRAAVDISDPDMTFGEVESSPTAPWTKTEQVHDKNFESPVRYATLEKNRWVLDGSFKVFQDDYNVPYSMGVALDELSGEDGTFENPQYVKLNFSGVSVLQALSVWFSTDPIDGVPADFMVEVVQGGTAYFSKEITGNTETSLSFDKFTVYNPEYIKLTITKWSLPGRRARVVEIVPGVYEQWDDKVFASMNVSQQGNFSCITLPYGTMDISINNKSWRFEPRKKDSLFQSIEERQGIKAYIGVRLPSGIVEYKPVGVYYQSGDGWKTSDNGITISWSLVDIIGLLADRTYLPPDTLQTTLDGWIASVVAQLGENFKKLYRVDGNYATMSVTANSKDDVTGKTCGDIIRWACMKTGTFPRADSETGYLTVEPLWNQGGKILLRNILNYPTMKANESVATLIFKVDGTEYVVSGNATSSEKTISIENPFLHSQQDALTAARQILSCYGGNLLETTGRGDPISEIGDVDTVWLDESTATTGRRMYQSFSFSQNVMQGCQSRLLQADGSYLFEEFEIITESGTWTAPDGVTQIRVVIGQGGSGGMKGDDGYIRISDGVQAEPGVDAGYGEDGTPGSGGKIWFGVININPGQTFAVQIGQGGAPSDTYGVPGAEGQHTTFGVYTSADGAVYPYGYTDITNGSSYGRTGVAAPLPGSSDGGQAGSGGMPGAGYTQYYEREVPGGIERGWELIIVQRPTGGKPGTAGGSGFVLVSWDKEAV